MIDDRTLTEAIDKSPLTPEDKTHWKALLPKLNAEHRERLLHSLIAKTEISATITLIEKALAIIAQAEAEAEAEVTTEDEKKKEKETVLQELETLKTQEEDLLLNEEKLKQRQEETKRQIEQIRQDLHALSLEVHGEPPPSMTGPQSPPQLSH